MEGQACSFAGTQGGCTHSLWHRLAGAHTALEIRPRHTLPHPEREPVTESHPKGCLSPEACLARSCSSSPGSPRADANVQSPWPPGSPEPAAPAAQEEPRTAQGRGELTVAKGRTAQRERSGHGLGRSPTDLIAAGAGEAGGADPPHGPRPAPSRTLRPDLHNPLPPAPRGPLPPRLRLRVGSRTLGEVWWA